MLPKARAVRPAYEESRERVAALAAGWDALPPGLFDLLEVELGAMSGRPVEANALTTFRSCVNAMLDYHNTGFRHLKEIAGRMNAPVRAELLRRGRRVAALILEALESDLEFGSALSESTGTSRHGGYMSAYDETGNPWIAADPVIGLLGEPGGDGLCSRPGSG